MEDIYASTKVELDSLWDEHEDLQNPEFYRAAGAGQSWF